MLKAHAAVGLSLASAVYLSIDMDRFYWRNKVAVITGASVGIGASTALALANAGMVVVGLARRVDLIEVSVQFSVL